jgi:hypothetical protein
MSLSPPDHSPKLRKTIMPMTNLNPAPRPALEKPKNQAAKAAGKKAYRKPKLRRLGQLKSVAGSGISW